MSIYVEWAKEVIESYIKHNRIPENMKFRNNESLTKKAACFVSIHLKNGSLRGCVGTILPYEETLYEEIRNNAISASTRDTRFYPVSVDELEELEISVDVLSEIWEVEDRNILNPKKYGVIVEKNGKRGLLLPDLEGVDSVESQLRIAREKAGLFGYTNDEVKISCFTVTRYH